MQLETNSIYLKLDILCNIYSYINYITHIQGLAQDLILGVFFLKL